MNFRSLRKKALIAVAAALTIASAMCAFTSCDSEQTEESDTEEYIYVPESTTSDGVLTPEQVGDGQCFLNSFAKVGVELVCHGYPEGVTYNWKISHMTDGKEDTFANDTGRYTPTDNDLESMITVSVDGYEDLSIYCSELPVLYFTSDVKYDAINKTQYTDTYLKMQGNSEVQTGLYDGNAKLRLRGNSTAGLEKRPFKLKLDSKENMLGMADGKNKHWVLLANAIDHTLMRNKLLYDFSGAIGTDVYMHSENVVLIYNGEYYGVYQLCEHLRVDSNRVDVYDWEDALSDAAKAVAKLLCADGSVSENDREKTEDDIENKLTSDWSWIDSGKFKYNGKEYKFSDLGIELPETNGGYLIEMDFYSRGDETLSRIESAYLQPLYFSTIGEGSPKATASFAKTSLYKNALSYMQSFEYALHSTDFTFRNDDVHYSATGWWAWWSDSEADAVDKYGYMYYESDYEDAEHEGWHYSDFFDMDSLVKNFIFCEYAMNWDSMKNSFFYYKDVDEKAYVGPQWDFDWAWGNKNMYSIDTNYPESWHTTEDAFTVEQYYQKVQWNRMLIRDPYFIALAYEKYHEIRDTVIEEMIMEGGTIDLYYEDLRTAALANDHKWKKTYKSYGGETFDDAVASMKEFLETRIKWLDEQFGSMKKLVYSLGYYQPSNNLKITEIVLKEDGGATISATVSGNKKIKKVAFQLNGTTILKADVVDGVATVEVEAGVFTSEHINCVEVKAMNVSGNYIYDTDASDSGVFNQAISNYKVFDLAK